MKISITYKNKLKDIVKVSVGRIDVCDADLTLARVIYPVLKKYKRVHEGDYKGCPFEFAFDDTKPESPDNKDRFDDWLKCLDSMIYSFEWVVKKRDWGDLEIEHSKKIQEGIDLFAKYFRHLWL